MFKIKSSKMKIIVIFLISIGKQKVKQVINLIRVLEIYNLQVE